MKKISRLATLSVLGVSLAAPLLAFAQSGLNLNAITPYSDGIKNVINDILVPVLIAIAFIVFLWGIFKAFIWNGASEGEKADGRKFAMWGIIGFVIIISLWGIVNLVMGALGFTAGTTAPTPPTFNPGSGSSAPAGGANSKTPGVTGTSIIGGGSGSNIQAGGDCTGNSSGCAAGLFCVPGDYGSVCSTSSSGG